MEAWPGSLPQKVKGNYSIEPRCGLMDEDEIRNPQRLRTYPEYDATFSMIMDSDQLSTFRAWWNDTLNQCAPFTAPWLDSLGFDFHFLRLTKTPSWKLTGVDHFTVTLPVEIIAGVEINSDGDPEIYAPEDEESE